MSSLPPAMLNSSIVPMTRSNSGRMRDRCAVTPASGMKRVSPSPRAGEAPQHRAVVDVEHRAHVVPARALAGQRAHAVHVRRREVRAGDQQRLRLCDEVLVDVVRGDRHVGAVLAIEHQRERVLVLDAEHHRRGEARRVAAHVRHVAAFARERLDEEVAHRVVADPRGHRRLEAEARAAERGVRRGAAEVLGERRHVLEPRADLLRVEIHREAAKADDVEPAAGDERRGVLHRGATIGDGEATGTACAPFRARPGRPGMGQ